MFIQIRVSYSTKYIQQREQPQVISYTYWFCRLAAPESYDMDVAVVIAIGSEYSVVGDINMDPCESYIGSITSGAEKRPSMPAILLLISMSGVRDRGAALNDTGGYVTEF